MDTITIIQHNVHTWNTNKFLLSNTYLQQNPDIILLNSTGVKDTETIKVFGYNTYKINSQNTLHDGSAILVKTNIQHRITDDFDTDVLQVTISTITGPINIATTYLPPRRPYLPFTDFHRLATQNAPTYIIGDLNARHTVLNYNDCNNVGKAIKKLIDNKKLNYQGPHFHTFFSSNNTSTPDIILTNNKTYHNMEIKPGPTTSSDHIPILIKITTHAIKTTTAPIPNYNAANWEMFTRDTEDAHKNINTNPYMTTQQLNTSLQQWTNTITDAMKTHIPLKRTITQQKALTNHTIKSLTYYAENITTESNISGWSPLKYATLKRIKHAIIKECKHIQNKHWEDKIKTLVDRHKDAKKFWSQIKRLKGNPNNLENYIIHDNEKIYNIERQEQIFRNIWSKNFQISQQEKAEFDQHTDNIVTQFLDTNIELFTPHPHGDPDKLNDNHPLLYKITTDTTKHIIKTLKNNTPGESKINKTILQNLSPESTVILTKLFNIALSMGYFPENFKHAKLKLIPKANKQPTDPNNYRPISLLEVQGKIFEKIINQRLRTHLETHTLIPASQHGFRQNKSTNTAIATLTELLANALTTNKITTIVTRDISKAFDKVWHQGLKYKLTTINLPDNYIKLLSSFLDSRTARITIKTHTGPPIPLLSGVPQGSNLSPTLFSIYTSDIPLPGPQCTYIAYADDITQIISQPGKSRKFLARKVQAEISKINQYENKWKIKTNINKFNIFPVSIIKTEPINVNNHIIPYSSKANILGLTIHNKGYTRQITNNIAKAKHALYTLKIFHKLTTNIKLHLIKACVIPMLIYPDYPLATLSKHAISKLQKIQNQALRFAYNEKYPYRKTTLDLHQLSNLKPINIILHERAQKTKYTLQHILQDNTYIQTITENQNNNSEHTWFKKTAKALEREVPQPLYT